MNNLLQIESFDVNQLPELQGMKEKQLQIVRENPFVEIIDNKTYDEAKKARTALVSARTEIQNQDKLIASKIKKFRESVSGASEELIAITRPHEEKQQNEVKRWEEIKEKEKQEKARIEEERKNNIRNSINALIDESLSKINKLSFDTIESLKVDFEQNLFKTDVAQFEEFEIDFNEKLIQVKNAFSSKVKVLEEAEAQRLENIRLQAEAARLEAERKRLEAEQKAEAERLKKIQEEQELAIKLERAAIEAEKAAQEAILKQKEEEAKKAREDEEARLKKEREDLEAEKQRLAKIEADRVAKEEAERKQKEEAERIAKEKEEEEARVKAEAERLEALKPEKQKAIEFLESNQFSMIQPEINDEELKKELFSAMQRIADSISDAVFTIKNFK